MKIQQFLISRIFQSFANVLNILELRQFHHSQSKPSSFVYKGVHFECHSMEPGPGFDHMRYRTVSLISGSLPQAVHRAEDAVGPGHAAATSSRCPETMGTCVEAGNNVNARHLARFAFLPPRIWEWLRIMFERDSED